MIPQTPEPFELYAIRYARHTGRRAHDNYIGPVDFHDAESDLDYYVWASDLPLLDTTALHAKAAVDFALGAQG